MTSDVTTPFKNPTHQAFLLLRTVFAVAPILFGLDKFTNVMTDWTIYLAPWIDNIVPGDAVATMRIVGVIEIAAGILVAVAPRIGAYVVALWLTGIIVNLLTLPASTTSRYAISDYLSAHWRWAGLHRDSI